MPPLLPRKIPTNASVFQSAGLRPSPHVHWVGILISIYEATYRFTLVTACRFANWELTTPCCQNAAPLNYRSYGQLTGRDFNPLDEQLLLRTDAHAFMRFPHFADCLVFRFKEFEPPRRPGLNPLRSFLRKFNWVNKGRKGLQGTLPAAAPATWGRSCRACTAFV